MKDENFHHDPPFAFPELPNSGLGEGTVLSHMKLYELVRHYASGYTEYGF